MNLSAYADDDSVSRPVGLTALTAAITRRLSVPELQNVWLTAELSDVNVRGGHCYMELLEKNPSSGQPVAKARAVIWANYFTRINAEFRAATGQPFTSGMKVMLRGSVSFHSLYGLSIVVSAVNPAYTMGDLEQRRREILMRLKREGVLELNRSLTWPTVPLRIAVVSAPTAAGFGDFANQLFTHPSHLRFTCRLFPAVMQGEQAPGSIMAALDAIAGEYDLWDCAVIIRGGGASSDLAAFDNYDLASHIAQFPLPVIVGIGHERDVTVLDYVANMRVKTPTAAAEWLIARGTEALGRLQFIASSMLQSLTDRIAGCRSQLAHYSAMLPMAPTNAIARCDSRLRQSTMTLAGIGGRRIAPELTRLTHKAEAIKVAADNLIARQRDRLNNREGLIDAYSPMATLRRGYSITSVDGHALTSVNDLTTGRTITTTLADGTITSSITNIHVTES
ncbi:MAG: exodeoxyribonuclease VII large subunit [Paramuribaculum sp.]|nr:exodeoxyribonuclease VII large subunit [Paramuribaculum sp.]